jgi:hypothetical protein
VQYRLIGGPVRVDQRVTVFADGLVELDERHRSRDPVEVTIGAQELERMRAALEQVPEEAWSRGPNLAFRRVASALRDVFRLWPRPDLGRSYFQLRCEGRTISGQAGDETEAEPARALLDDLRVQAMRRAESEKPTGL